MINKGEIALMTIGFELYSNQAFSVLPGNTFSLSILQKGKRIATSLGKDVYHMDRMILPNKRIAATGRIHYLSTNTTNPYEALQSTPCCPVPYAEHDPISLVIDLSVPNEKLKDHLTKTCYLHFIRHIHYKKLLIPLYLDPESFQSLSPTQLHLDISTQIQKYIKAK